MFGLTDMLLFDKLPAAASICLEADAPCANFVPAIAVWYVRCQGDDFRKKGGSPVNSSYLFYLITLQMTNKTFPVGREAD